MKTLRALIETHEEWLTDRVVHYAQQNSLTDYSSTLREAWRISICKLSTPLVGLIDSAQSTDVPNEIAIKEATEFGVTEGLKHRSLGIKLHEFVKLLKLYRRAYCDLIWEKGPSENLQQMQEAVILELFDTIELGLITAWTSSEEGDQLGELQKRNRELSNEKNKYLTVFESIAEPAILLDSENRPTHVNAAANSLLLNDTKPGAGYYGNLDDPLLLALIAEILKSGDSSPDPVELKTQSGPRQFDVSIQDMLDISRKFSGQVIILQDVTDYLHAIEAAQAADRAKSVFLTTLSHEIRTPINSILGLTRLLEDADIPTSRLKQLRSIRASGELLSELIENVLGLSKAETNALQLVEQDFQLTELTDALFQVLELDDINRQIKLEKRIDADVPLFLHGDSHKLRHVLLNLLSNAVKFTEHGTVTLTVSVEERVKPDAPILRFEVIDTGMGIPKGEMATLFEPYVQGTNADAAIHGSGLGLAISKYLVEFLEGEITYHPNPEGGSIFGFSLQFAQSQQRDHEPKDLDGNSILVVEDDPVNAMVIEGYLKKLGNTVTIVNSYEDAVTALVSEEVDIVITDYRLGKKTGLDVVYAVQSSSLNKGEVIPVIMVTAAIPQDAKDILQHTNVSQFLEKPFSRSQLFSALSTASYPKATRKDSSQKIDTHISTKDLNRLLSDLGFTRCQAVVHSYQSNMPSIISGMQLHLNNKDLANVSALAHQLISASGFIGAWSLVRKAKELKALCKATNIQATTLKYAELLEESERTARELDVCWQRIKRQ